ncbi:GGDEF domain-containing protein [Dyella japonica]|uniref:diguanylate cyclase n=1 Tax=Dyella japonica A8 TaxID=1217721 RepID=A0A075K7Y3_9GAMM|nr:GGDEF domain-containing protein [Dyella japonica]AIF48273.1 diguanylate cyclase [Dyella japonica A8]
MLSSLITSGSIVVISLMFGLALLVAWRRFGLERHAALWAGSFLAAAVGHGLRTAGQIWPGQVELFATLACHASVASFALLAWGFRRRASRSSRGVMAGWLVFTVWILWEWIDHSQTWRATSRLLTATGDAYMVGWIVATLWHKRGTGALARWIMIFYGLYAMSVGVAAELARPGGIISDKAFILVLSIGTPTGMIGTGVMTLLIVASDLAKGLQQQARTDALTGLLNRRGVEDAIRALLGTARKAEPLTVVVVDLDYFKAINDRLGHAAGDDVLLRFAQHLKTSLRAHDVVARIGGEEFVLLLPQTPRADAMALVERLRCSVPEAFAHDTNLERVSASFGVTQVRRGETFDAALARADEALYRSKHEGRDRATHA